MNKRQLARLKKVRNIMKAVKPALVNMHRYEIGPSPVVAGCALHHYEAATGRTFPMDIGDAIDRNIFDYLFLFSYGRKHTGAPAKREFLKRINPVIRKAEKELGK